MFLLVRYLFMVYKPSHTAILLIKPPVEAPVTSLTVFSFHKAKEGNIHALDDVFFVHDVFRRVANHPFRKSPVKANVTCLGAS